MTSDTLGKLLSGAVFLSLLVTYLGPDLDEDGGRWASSWPVKIANAVALVSGVGFLLLQWPGLLSVPWYLWVPTIGLTGYLLVVLLRLRHRRLAAQREAARLSEARRPELTE